MTPYIATAGIIRGRNEYLVYDQRNGQAVLICASARDAEAIAREMNAWAAERERRA